MTTKKTAKPESNTTPVTKQLTWRDVVIARRGDLSYQPRKGPLVFMSFDMAKKSLFYKVVGKNLMVLQRQQLQSHDAQVSALRHNVSELGERAKLITEKTRTKDLIGILFEKNAWRKANEQEKQDYAKFVKDRDALVAKVVAAEQAREIKALKANVDYHRKCAEKAAARLAKFSLEVSTKP